jgi:hypothetical protein
MVSGGDAIAPTALPSVGSTLRLQLHRTSGSLSWTLAIFRLAGVESNVIERRIRG